MKEKGFRNYAEYEWMKMEQFIKNKKREMDHMGKYFEDDFEEYYGGKEKRHHKDCDCKKKHHWCDHDDDHGHDKDEDEIYYCKCKKKKKDDHKKDCKCKHEHKHYHKHEYKYDHKDRCDDKKDDHKKDHCGCKEEKCKRKEKAEVVDFKCKTMPMVDSTNQNPIQIATAPNNTEVATIAVDKVCKGDKVVVNGVIGLRGFPPIPIFELERNVTLRIFKSDENVIGMGNQVYTAQLTVEDGDYVQFPFLLCDKIAEAEKKVRYTVTLEENTFGAPISVEIVGPVTLTATVIDKKRGY